MSSQSLTVTALEFKSASRSAYGSRAWEEALFPRAGAVARSSACHREVAGRELDVQSIDLAIDRPDRRRWPGPGMGRPNCSTHWCRGSCRPPGCPVSTVVLG